MLSSLTATGPMCGALWFGTGQGGEDLGSKGGLQTVKIMQILRERQGNKMKQKSRPNLSLQGDTRGPQPSPGVSDRRHPLVAVLGVLGAQLQGLLVLVGEVHGEVMLRGQGGVTARSRGHQEGPLWSTARCLLLNIALGSPASGARRDIGPWGGKMLPAGQEAQPHRGH